MKTNNIDERVNIKSKLERVNRSISTRDYKTSVNLMISVYEEAIKILYKTYLGQIDNPGDVLQCIIELNKDKKPSIRTMQFGQFIGFLKNTSFLEEVIKLLPEDANKKFQFDKSEFIRKISELNKIRVQDVHQNVSTLPPEFVKMNFEYLKLFLKKFGVDSRKETLIEFGSLKTQKIVGEIQLYKSLNNVFYTENVDCLDATYFSAKIPKHQKHEEIGRYWTEVEQRLKNGSLTLRRIISLSNEDKRNSKLLWLLFDLIPKHYEYLNKSAFFSVFKTSRVRQYKESDKSAQIVNLIMMYNRENPNIGHAWLFSTHTETHVNEREYLYLYGDNISILKSIFNDMYLSSDKLNNDLIKEMISQQTNEQVDIERVNNAIIKLDQQKDILFSKDDIELIKTVYEKIFNNENQEEGFVF